MDISGNGDGAGSCGVAGEGEERKLKVMVGWVQGLRVPGWELTGNRP
jgi:hypothetical protein